MPEGQKELRLEWSERIAVGTVKISPNKYRELKIGNKEQGIKDRK